MLRDKKEKLWFEVVKQEQRCRDKSIVIKLWPTKVNRSVAHLLQGNGSAADLKAIVQKWRYELWDQYF